ncbi:MAG: HAMP domain-containing histidine kinase [Phaeodactylibacter sp.]|nr:HAMP domain-containing histidine kinase [Phaeodactylibacter sp.]MCB9276107.1 HAMP domain-containing histidine kinase [Lewinellaceae bacterium]
MKIKNKIALTFTLSTSGLIVIFCFTIYFLFKQYVSRDFYQELEQRAQIVASFMLEADEMEPAVFNEARSKHIQKLPFEEEYIVPLSTPPEKGLLPEYLDAGFIEEIVAKGYAVRHAGKVFAAGIRYEDNQGNFAVIVAAPNKLGDAELVGLRKILAFVVITGMVIIFLIARWYANQALAPLSSIITQMENIDANNLFLRIVSGKTEDEIERVAHAFNKLLDRIETAIETQINFISNASHELKTPLTAILGEIGLGLHGQRTAEEYRQCLVRVEKHAELLRALIIRLLRLAQVGVSEDGKAFILARIDELLVDVVEEFNQANPHARILLHFENLPEDPLELEIMANANLLKIAFANLIDNAFKFSEGKQVDVYLEGQGPFISIRICDQGLGIPADAIGKIFDPFFRADNVMDIHGFGVGLPLVKKIIHIHEGQIEASSDVGRGTAITLRLPKRQF